MTTVTPYEDDRSYLLDELERLDRLLEHRLATWWDERGASFEDLSGLYISDAEVMSLLESSQSTTGLQPSPDRDGLDGGMAAPTGGGTDGRRASTERLTEHARRIRRRRQRTRERGRTLRFDALAEAFGLTNDHREIVLIALAPELDPKYERIYAYLHDDMTRTTPTVGLVLRILGVDTSERVRLRELLTAGSPLRRHRLLAVDSGPTTPLPAATIHADERLVDYLLGGDALPTALSAFTEVVHPTVTVDALADDGRGKLERLARTLCSLADSADDADDADAENVGAPPVFAHVHGPYGSGRASGIEAVCGTAGLALVRADVGSLPIEEWTESVVAVIREARLRRAALAVDVGTLASDERGERDVGQQVVRRLVRQLDGFEGPVFVVSRDPFPPSVFLDVKTHTVSTVGFPRAGYDQRRALWAAVPDLPEDVDPDRLAATFRFTPGEIDDALTTARRLVEGGELTRDAVYHGCRIHARGSLGTLARRIEPQYSWDDIVLPSDRFAQLEEVAARIRHRGRVYADWGFEDKYSLGNGLTVLFTGPSGTGKTMATEIIANDVGLDLYKVDLAGVVSKYIGETEKNLREIFDEAEGSDAILLFDEADALFGKRSDVSDARDRYANIEVNYLLQRIEEHDGIAILTTNLEGNIDEAFERRIHVSVEFPMPDETSRAEIWQGVFPEETPIEHLDVAFLSSLELSGGNIKNVALNAAFYAAEENASVGMPHVIRAVRREYQKIGRLFSVDEFGEYRSYLTRSR